MKFFLCIYTLLHRLENSKSWISSFFLVVVFNSTFKRKKSALKISIVKFSFYFVGGMNM